MSPLEVALLGSLCDRAAERVEYLSLRGPARQKPDTPEEPSELRNRAELG